MDKADEKQQLVTGNGNGNSSGNGNGNGNPGNICQEAAEEAAVVTPASHSSHSQSQSQSVTQSLGWATSSTKPTPPQHVTRVAYVSERKTGRKTKENTAGGRSQAGAGQIIGGRDSKKTQAALLRLLAAFREPPPSTAADQLALIRQQQDDLARLHFKLGSDPDAPAKPVSARETMARLVHSLEQLSASIEQLHTMTDHSTPPADGAS